VSGGDWFLGFASSPAVTGD